MLITSPQNTWKWLRRAAKSWTWFPDVMWITRSRDWWMNRCEWCSGRYAASNPPSSISGRGLEYRGYRSGFISGIWTWPCWTRINENAYSWNPSFTISDSTACKLYAAESRNLLDNPYGGSILPQSFRGV